MNSPADPLTLTLGELIELLAPAIGTAKATDVVESCVRLIAPRQTVYTRDDALRIFTHACSHGGLVGLAAHRARQRLQPGGGWSRAKLAAQKLEGRAGATATPVLIDRVIELLASSLGEVKAREEVRRACAELGFSWNELSAGQTERLLALLGQSTGVVGAAARLARVRLGFPDAGRPGPGR